MTTASAAEITASTGTNECEVIFNSYYQAGLGAIRQFVPD